MENIIQLNGKEAKQFLLIWVKKVNQFMSDIRYLIEAEIGTITDHESSNLHVWAVEIIKDKYPFKDEDFIMMSWGKILFLLEDVTGRRV
jgi:hypothetical protein